MTSEPGKAGSAHVPPRSSWEDQEAKENVKIQEKGRQERGSKLEVDAERMCTCLASRA